MQQQNVNIIPYVEYPGNLFMKRKKTDVKYLQNRLKQTIQE